MQSISDWTQHELDELVAFFTWMDALCAEAVRHSQTAPWPAADRTTSDLNHWLQVYRLGLTPTQALVHRQTGGTVATGM